MPEMLGNKKKLDTVKATKAKTYRNHIKSTDQVMDVVTSPVQQYICQLFSKTLLLSSPKFIHCYHYHDWAWLFSKRSQFHLLPISPRSILYDLPSVATVSTFSALKVCFLLLSACSLFHRILIFYTPKE